MTGKWWKAEDLKLVRQRAKHYRKAARAFKLPWLMLPVIHKAERGLKITPVTGGWCQLDLGGRDPAHKKAEREKWTGRAMAFSGGIEYGPLRSDFVTGCWMCAFWLSRKLRPAQRCAPWPEKKIGRLFMLYNGAPRYYNAKWQATGEPQYATKGNRANWRWSPYAANWLDARQLYVMGRQYDKGKRVRIERKKYRQPGAVLLYRELRRRLA